MQRFNDEALQWPYAKQLAVATTYWVFDAATGLFGPSKFVGFSGLNATTYDDARAGRVEGTPFDGGVSKAAIADAVGDPYREAQTLSEKLIRWAEAIWGSGVFGGVDRSKWRFVVVPDRGAAPVLPRSPDERGSPRVSRARQVGSDYRPADENVGVAQRDPFSMDPVAVDRANRAHAATQNALAAFLGTLGIEPRSPAPDDPDADLLWERDGTVFVAEVKSITDSNEEKQLRLALGQVLRYRQLLAVAGHRAIAVLVAERAPAESWQALCEELGVVLAWPGDFARVVVTTKQR